MKKLLLLTVLAAGGAVACRQWLATRDEDDLWAEVTADPQGG